MTYWKCPKCGATFRDPEALGNPFVCPECEGPARDKTLSPVEMSEPMSNQRLTKDQIEEARAVYRLNPSKFEFELDLIGEIDCLNAEIVRLEKALEGSESLRHTTLTAALDAKRTFTKRIAELEKVNENLAAAYHQLVDKCV